MTLSVVIPAYNVESYIEECLDSVFSQSEQFDEVIVVNDGSTDGTKKLIEKYSGHVNLKYMEQVNSGLSAARNTGIRESSSDYIIFLDGDDYLDLDACRELKIALGQTDHQVIIFGLNSFYEEEPEKIVYRTPFTKKVSVEKEDAFFEALEKSVSACIKCIHRDLLKNGVFPVGKKYEDLITTPKLMYQANSVGVLRKHLYFYRLGREGSIRAAGNVHQVDSFHDAYISNSLFAKKVGLFKGYWQRFVVSYFRRFVNGLIVDDLIVKAAKLGGSEDKAALQVVEYAINKLESGEILNRQTIERFLPKDGTYKTYLYIRDNVSEFKTATGLLAGIQLTRKLTRANSDLAAARKQLRILGGGRFLGGLISCVKKAKSKAPVVNSLFYHASNSINSNGAKHLVKLCLVKFGINSYHVSFPGCTLKKVAGSEKSFWCEGKYKHWLSGYNHSIYLPPGDSSILVMLEKWFSNDFFTKENSLILLESGPAFKEVFEKLKSDGYSVVALPEIKDLSMLSGMCRIFYPWNVSGVQKLMRVRSDVDHIFIGHGESDKVFSCESNFHTYDKIFVSGPSMVDRLVGNRVLTVDEVKDKIVQIGMPYISNSSDLGQDQNANLSVESISKVLYAPTWEFDWRGVSYSSLASSMSESVIGLLLDSGAQVTVRPHPNTGASGAAKIIFPKIARMIDKFSGNRNFIFNVVEGTMLDRFLKRNAESIYPTLDFSFHKSPNNFDLILTDISSVATWAATCKKPFLTLINEHTEKVVSEDGIKRYPVLSKSVNILASEVSETSDFKSILIGKINKALSPEKLQEMKDYVIGYEDPAWEGNMPSADSEAIYKMRPFLEENSPIENVLLESEAICTN
ncbi:glycosyltransferase family 2 protein [Microbulbifer sp.]|uniref:glycosyltransferase family 2 protein n=1 Tax=Microbulbifer sp. TaxID=1908541 RepID=UPI00258E1AB2|nr:glycosyltransferase family 2 protein [Microbulbifer sp.]